MSKESIGGAKNVKVSIATVANDNCPSCDKAVKDTDLALECEICESWFHIKCEDVSDEEYTFLGAHKSIHWYCNACHKSVASVSKLFSSVKQKVDSVDREVSDLSKQVILCDRKLSQI